MRHLPMKSRNVFAIAGIASAALLVVSGCSTTADSSDEPAAEVASSTPVNYPKAPAPTTMTSTKGARVSVPAANKPTVMVFYSVGCGTCLGITQQIAKTATEFPNAEYLAVNLDPTEDIRTSNGFLDYVDSPDIVGINDVNGKLTNAYGVKSVSTVVVVNKEGKIVLNEVLPKPDVIDSTVKTAAS